MGSTRFVAISFVAVLAVLPVSAGADDAPLAAAVKRRDRTKIASLLAQNVDVNAAQADGMTALHWAAYHDDAKTAKRILAAGGNAQAANRYGVTPLSIACQNGNGTIVEMLLDAGADANATLRGGETALMTAARTGKLGPVQALIAHGAKVNAQERKGQTALMWAAAEGNVEAVDALLKASAEFRTPLKSGFTPLFFAVREGKTGVVQRLLAEGLNVNDAMPGKDVSPLLLAVENGHFELAAALLEAGADPNDKRTGYSPLHALTWIRKPLGGDGDPPPVGSGNMTSLQLARKLIERGADVNSRHGKHKSGDRLNHTQTTPFLLASETADLALMRLLLASGADASLKNAEDVTPLLAASGVGILGSGFEPAATEDEAIAAIKLLLKRGADINAVDDNGETVIHAAAYRNWPKLIGFLVEKGADVDVWNRKNKRGWTPLLIAQGHRPGNFRPSAETVVAVQKAMRAAGVEPPAEATPRRQR
jgi:ankyrin repeat protein